MVADCGPNSQGSDCCGTVPAVTVLHRESERTVLGEKRNASHSSDKGQLVIACKKGLGTERGGALAVNRPRPLASESL